MQPRRDDQPGEYRPAGAMSRSDERIWMVLAHLSAPIAALLSAGSLSILGPLLIWLFAKDRSPDVRRAAAGAFNFNVAFWLLYVLGWVLLFTVIGIPVALLLWAVIFIVSVIAHLTGAVRAARGESFSYPFQIRILS